MSRIIKVPSIYLIHRLGMDDNDSYLSQGKVTFENIQNTTQLNPQSRVLEIGSKCGYVARYLTNYFNDNGKYVGLDDHVDMISWCNENLASFTNNLVFQQANLDGTELLYPFDDQSFDVVILNHATNQNFQDLLREIHRILKVKGKCYCQGYLENPPECQGFMVNDFIRGTWKDEHSPSDFYMMTSHWAYDPRHNHDDTLVITKN